MFVLGRFPSTLAFLKTVVPFAVIFGVGVAFGRLPFLYAWLGVVAFITFLLVVGAMCKRMPGRGVGESDEVCGKGSDDADAQRLPLRRCLRR